MGLGMMEWVAILVIGLLVFGPSRLPGLGKSVGEAIRGFKSAMNGEDESPSERVASAPPPTSLTSATPAAPAEQKQKEPTGGSQA